MFHLTTLRLLAGLLLTLTACGTIPTPAQQASTPQQPTVTATLPTATTAPTTSPLPTATAAATNTAPAPSEALPTTSEDVYRVAFLAPNDVLNVRTGPGADNDIAGTLPPDAQGITITGKGREVANAVWVPIAAGELEGWVNSRFLTGQVASEDFCGDVAVLAVLDELETAVATQDSALLAQLTHPERGLRLHHDWWNPAVWLSTGEVGTLFESTTSYEWGTADGSGLPISGSFSEVMLPLLEEDLLNAIESACNQLPHGATAGDVRLPNGYAQVNHYGLHRPPADIEFDWGTWAVGIELWQGAYHLSYLVHYDYEI